VAPPSSPGRAEFESALQAHGVDGRLAAQLLEAFELLLASDGQSRHTLAELLFDAVNGDGVDINRQFLETASMLIDTVTDAGLAVADNDILIARFAEILEGGGVSRKQNAELRALIDSPDFSLGDAPEADADPSEPPALPEPIESQKDNGPHEELVSVPVEPSLAVGDTRPLTPAATGVDPEQWDTSSDQSDDQPGLSALEFVHALYATSALSGLSQTQQLRFSQYAESVFMAYANDDDLLFDYEILLMQDDGMLVETDDGWALDFNTVTQRIESPLMAMPGWLAS